MIHGGDELAMASILCIVREARRKKIRYVKAAFERPMSERIMHQFKAFKFFKSRLTPWGSACLDLSLPSDSLLKNLNGKWRNGLRKAEKLELLVKRETLNEQNLTSVISWYESFQIGKNFTGISKALLSEFSKRNSEHFNSKVFFAHHPESSAPLGMLLTITSGGVSTYLIGVSNAEGRKAQVNSLLLWQAIMDAKSEGMRLFDLGGLNEETPAGIAKFKKGLNGSPYQLVGEWHLIPSWTLI
jgi:lipid II:glycine glycyltransferase (peptidoglycan interpeptide bridge formation enzyme)